MELKISTNPQDYLECLKNMENRVNQIIENKSDELVWMLNHPTIYTSGSNDNKDDLLDSQSFPVIQTNRGGKYTYHGPGQRVVYLMLNLNNRTKDIKKFVSSIESIIINTLKTFNIEGISLTKHHGVFVKKKIDNKYYKIASIGLKFKKWVTYHGFSININPNLSHYKGIRPCGLDSEYVTSFYDLGFDIDIEDFDDILVKNMFDTFNELHT